MYSDPSGHIAIATLILIGIVTAAIVTTAAAVTYAVIEEETIVLDLSYSLPVASGLSIKAGGSLLLDFEGGNIEFYTHAGEMAGYSSGPSYSVGKVWNYDEPGDYDGVSVFAGGGCFVGGDFGYAPKKGGTFTTSLTFSMGNSAYVGTEKYYNKGSFNYKRRAFN